MSRRPAASEQEIDGLAQALLEDLLSTNVDNLESVIRFIEQAAGDPSVFTDLARFKHKPVVPMEFVTSPEFMDKPTVLWPRVMAELEEMNSGSYTEIVLTGGIGVAKTTLALYSQAYQLYLLSCLRSPHAEFDLDPATEIMIIFQSINANLAKTVDYQRFRSMIDAAPYFRNQFPFDHSREAEMRFPNRIVVKPVSGLATAAIGQNVIGGIIDELNFMAVVKDSKNSSDGTYDQAVENYNSLARRRESRFLQKGWLPGLLCLVSSRRYPGQFTDIKEAEARTNPRIYVYDKRLWEIAPEGRFGDEWFHVFTGDSIRKPRLIDEDEALELLDSDDARLVTRVPCEFQKSFENDLLAALRDIAGVSTLALHPFMLNQDAVVASFGRVPGIFSREDADFVATQLLVYPKRFFRPEEPRYVHLDLAVTGDSAGLAIGFVEGFEEIERGKDEIEVLPVIRLDAVLEIRPPRNGEISFAKIRALIYLLREQGLNIRWVSADSFQSTDSLQILAQQGFMTGKLSVDVSTKPYDITKQAIYDGRLLAPAHAKACQEFIRLERNPKTNKIDHPPNFSKDCSDAVAGVTSGLTMRREIWFRHGVPLMRIPQRFLGTSKDHPQSVDDDNGAAVAA